MEPLNMKNMISNKRVLFSPMRIMGAFFSAALVPGLAFASGETPVGDGLSYITGAMYGATGIAIATIAVMIVGLLCLGHVLKWSALGYTIIGISIMFGAGAIVSGVLSLIHL